MKKNSLVLGAALLLTPLLATACGGAPVEVDDTAEGTFTAYKAAKLVSWAASKYGEAVTPEALLEKAGITNGEEKNSNADAMKLLYAGFGEKMPERIGARIFQGYDYDLENVKGLKTTDDCYKAVKFFVDKGVFTSREGSTFTLSRTLPRKDLLKLIERLHAYIGTSETDDYFSTINHDFLYDKNPNGLPEVDDDGNELAIYDSNLIPQSRINAWAKGIVAEGKTPNASAFTDTYFDFDARKPGNAAGVVGALKPLLEAKTIAEFQDAMLQMLKDTGYCPLWGDATYGIATFKYTSGDTATKVYAQATSYNNTETGAQAASNRGSRITRFSPIFQEILGCDEETGKRWGTAYAQFVVDFCNAKGQFSADDGALYQPTRISTDSPKTTDKFDLFNFLKDAGVKTPSWFLFSNGADTEAIMSLWDDAHLEQLKGLCIWQMAQHFSICLPDAEHVTAWAYKPGYANNEETLSTDGMYGTYCLPNISGEICNYFATTAQYKANVDVAVGLLKDLWGSFKARINSESWLSAEGKTKAASKIDDMKYVVFMSGSDGSTLSYDDPDYLSPAEGGTLYGNLSIQSNTTFDATAPRIGDDAQEGGFFDSIAATDPLTANAYYMPGYNGIDITMGYMAAYSDIATMSKEDLLASYGWVIGHEVSHSLDTNGMQFTNTGEHKLNWFSNADREAYLERSNKVVGQYEGAEVMPNIATKGTTVQTEAIADISGLTLCIDIAAKEEKFDYKKFFKRGATNFADYASQSTYLSNLADDEHPFGRVRVNEAYKAIDKFHEVYETTFKDGMYLDPSLRGVVW